MKIVNIPEIASSFENATEKMSPVLCFLQFDSRILQKFGGYFFSVKTLVNMEY